MKLKTFTAASMSQALASVKQEFGAHAVILHTRTYRKRGLLGLAGQSVVEVTAADGREVARQRERTRTRTQGLAHSIAGAELGPREHAGSYPSQADRPDPAPGSYRSDVSTDPSAPAAPTHHLSAAVVHQRRERLMARTYGRSRPRSELDMPERRAEAPATRRDADAAAQTTTAAATALRAPPHGPDQDHRNDRNDRNDSKLAPARHAASAEGPRSHAPTRGDADADPLADEMRNVKEMVSQLVREQRRSGMKSQIGDRLFDHYLALLEQEVTEELAQEIIEQVQAELARDAAPGVGSSPNGAAASKAYHDPSVREADQSDEDASGERRADGRAQADAASKPAGAPAAEPAPAKDADADLHADADEQAVRRVLARVIGQMVPTDDVERRWLEAAEAQAQRPRVIALIGPTGVGKTTTIAKLAANLKIKHDKHVAMVTLDTFRIAAVEQLRTYADIIGVRLEVACDPSELTRALERVRDADVVLIDTAGRSQRDDPKLDQLRRFIDAASPDEVHLVLSSTSTQRVILETVERFSSVRIDRMIFTKLDEAVSFGVVLNVLKRVNKSLSFITTGQEVPHQIEPGRPERLAELVLGARV